MSKLGKSLLQGAKEALDYAHKEKTKAGTYKIRVPTLINVKAIRLKLQNL